MNFFQDIWSRITGGRRREEEEAARAQREAQRQAQIQANARAQEQARAEAQQQAAAVQAPSRSLQKAMQIPGINSQSSAPANMETMLKSPQQPKPPVRRFDNTGRQLDRHGNPVLTADEIEAKAKADLEQERNKDWKSRIGHWLTSNDVAKNVVAPTVTGASQATFGLAGLAARPFSRKLSDDINHYALDQRKAVGDNSTLKLNENIPFIGGENPFMLASEALIDPTNAIPGAAGSGLLRKFAWGAGTAGLGGLIQPAENDADRLRNVGLSSLFGGVLQSVVPSTDVRSIPGSPDTFPRAGVVKKSADIPAAYQLMQAELQRILELPDTARIDLARPSAEQSELNRLNSQVQQQQLQRELANNPPEIREALSDVPPTDRDTNLRNLDVVPQTLVDTPSVLNDPTVTRLSPEERLLRDLNQQVGADLGGTADTVLDEPAFARELNGENIVDQLIMDERVPQSIRQRLLEQRRLEDAEELNLAQKPLTPDEPTITTADPATQGLIPNPANALPETPAVLPVAAPTRKMAPSSLADTEPTLEMPPSPLGTSATAATPAATVSPEALTGRDIIEQAALVEPRFRAKCVGAVCSLIDANPGAKIDVLRAMPANSLEEAAQMAQGGRMGVKAVGNGYPHVIAKADGKYFQSDVKAGANSQLFTEPQIDAFIKNGTVSEGIPMSSVTPITDEVLSQRVGTINPESVDQMAERAAAAGARLSAASNLGEAPDPTKVRAADEFRKTISKNMDLKTDEVMGTVAHDAEMQAIADARIDRMDEDELINKYQPGRSSDQNDPSGYNEPAPIRGAQNVHDALSAAGRLKELAENGNERALSSLHNLIDGLTLGMRSAGQELSIASRLADLLPPDMKANMTLARINDIREKAGLAKVEGPQAKQFVDSVVYQFEELSKARKNLSDLKTAAGAATDPKTALPYLEQVDDALRRTREIQGEINRAIDTIYPPKHLLEKVANYQRVMMLTSTAGRANDLISTTSNALFTLFKSIPEAAVGAVLNRTPFMARKMKASQGTIFNRALLSGTKSGFKDLVSMYKGNVQADNVYSTSQAYRAGQSNLIRAPRTGAWNRLKNTVTASVQAPTLLTKGIRDAELYRLAKSEAAQVHGLKGDEAELFAIKASLEPSPEIAQRAADLHEQINNVNDNSWANFAEGMFKHGSVDARGKGIRALVQNAIQPFVRFGATFAYNSVTRFNFAAASVRAAKGLIAGDARLASEGLAGMAVYGGLTMAGLELAKDGLIVADDPEGYKGGGPYIRIGNTYTSVGFLGNQIGMQLAMGLALKETLETGGDNLLEQFSTLAAKYAANVINVTGSQGLMGEGNNLTADLGRLASGGGENFEKGFLSRQTGRMLGQNIPALTSDINAFLNNSPMNPTGEEAYTRVEDENGKVDYTASSINQILNRIPGASQTLPRNEGVAADTWWDRVRRGSHLGTAQIDAENKEKSMAELSADLKARGIPDPYRKREGEITFAQEVQVKVESGDYKSAAEGLSHRLTQMREKGETQEAIGKVERQMGRLEIADTRGIKPEIFSLYPGNWSEDSITQEEFAKLGDPESEYYKPDVFNALYELDQMFAEAGLSNNNFDRNAPYYKLPKPKKGRGRGAGGNGAALSSPLNNRTIDIDSLGIPIAVSRKMPAIKRLTGRQLTVQPRRITVS